LFEEEELDIISCYHYPFNIRSKRVIEKCGFKYEGTLRLASKIYDGSIYDNACYSITKEDYLKGGRNYIITHRGDSTLKFLQHYGMMCYFTEVITKQYGFKRKPDTEAFTYLIEKYHINKSTAVVIGDRECEILGGKSAGIKTCLYNTNNVSLNIVPDFNIDSLKNLLDIIN